MQFSKHLELFWGVLSLCVRIHCFSSFISGNEDALGSLQHQALKIFDEKSALEPANVNNFCLKNCQRTCEHTLKTSEHIFHTYIQRELKYIDHYSQVSKCIYVYVSGVLWPVLWCTVICCNVDCAAYAWLNAGEPDGSHDWPPRRWLQRQVNRFHTGFDWLSVYSIIWQKALNSNKPVYSFLIRPHHWMHIIHHTAPTLPAAFSIPPLIYNTSAASICTIWEYGCM